MFAQGHNPAPMVRLDPATPQSRVKRSSTELYHCYSKLVGKKDIHNFTLLNFAYL